MKSDDFDASGASNNHNAPSSTPPSAQSAAQQNSISSSGGKARSGNNFRMKVKFINNISEEYGIS